MSLLGGIGTGIQALLQAILAAIGRFFNSLFQAEVDIVDNLQHIVLKFEETKATIEREVQALKDFEFNPRWNSRVINVPVAIDQMRELVSTLTNEFKSKLETLKAPIHDLSLIFKAEAEPTSDLQKPSALARTAVKVDEIATMIKQLAAAMDVVADFAKFFEEITNQIQTLDALFLQQGNRQKKETLTIRRRQQS